MDRDQPTASKEVPTTGASLDAPSVIRSTDAIDLEALARCIYDLLKRESRIERERLGVQKLR
ncbi:MAG: hypothetical protein KatS3mg052_1439 [Candidatus Roseilinea sp.]|nr:hypothetical protein [Candidatus Roseilinea sp. NK_OTU-006]GIV84432.1 MAG: hypothetical protein KatS3mg052_1439 [Candidatus Roseilinea sp.]